MILNVNFDQAISSLPTGFVSAVNYVVNYFDNLFTNNATITINVGWGEVGGSTLPSNALGASISNYLSESYSSTRNALLAHNASGSSTLPTTSPLGGTLYMTQAEAKALGLYSNSAALDGSIGFSNAVSWDYTTAAPTASQFYLIGTLEHEITEVMGRQSFIDGGPSTYYSTMDLYRYTAPNVRDLTSGGSGSTAYFSIDNGVTNLGTWNNNPNNGDLGDWYGSPYPSAGRNDAVNDYSSPGVINVFSASDITLMQALGWTTSTAQAAPTIASFSPDSGTVGDRITNATVLILTGTAPASSTVNVYDGATLLGTATANSSGAWSYTTGTLNNGSHSFTATDTVSNVTSAASAALAVTIDTIAPAAPVISSDVVVNTNDVALTGTAEANSTVKVYDGATLLGSTATNGSGAWAYTTGALSSGTHNLTATATDAASNVSAASQVVHPTIVTTVTIESFGSTSLTAVGNNFFLYANGTSSGPEVMLSGTAITSGQFGTWTPIGAEQTSTGYELAWHNTATNQYSVWTLDSNGNYITNNGALSGTSLAIETAETSFHQDLNGDGVIGVPAPVTIESFGSTSLTAVESNFFLYANGTSSGPEVMLSGAPITSGQFGSWTPIGAEQTSTGYELAWHNTATNQYSVWTLDSNGNYITNNGALSGTSLAIETAETSFHQDLNGDGVIGVPVPVTIESFGSTSLTEVGNNYFLYANGTSSGPAITLSGAPITSGQFGTWTPIGAEQTSTGYEVAWHNTATNQYSVWTLDSNGSYITNNGALSGTSLVIETAETSFHQDLNGDGVIGVPTASLISTTGSPGHTSGLGNISFAVVQSSSAIHGVTTEPVTVLSSNGSGSTPVLYGTTGSDTIVPTALNQTLFGNGGSDTFVFSGNIGRDTIADFQPANDVIQLDHNAFASIADVLAHAAQVGPDVAITMDASNSITLHNTSVTQLLDHNFHLV
jgi:hypothetical protein